MRQVINALLSSFVSMCTEVPAVIVSFEDNPSNKVGAGVTGLITDVGGNHGGSVQMGSLIYYTAVA